MMFYTPQYYETEIPGGFDPSHHYDYESKRRRCGSASSASQPYVPYDSCAADYFFRTVGLELCKAFFAQPCPEAIQQRKTQSLQCKPDQDKEGLLQIAVPVEWAKQLLPKGTGRTRNPLQKIREKHENWCTIELKDHTITGQAKRLEYRYLKVNATLDAFGQNAAAEVITELIHEGCGQSGTSAYTMYFVTKQRQAGAVLGKGGSQIEAIRREHGNIIKIQQNQADLVNRSESQDILCNSDELIAICSTREKLKAVAKDTAIKLMEYQAESSSNRGSDTSSSGTASPVAGRPLEVRTHNKRRLVSVKRAPRQDATQTPSGLQDCSASDTLYITTHQKKQLMKNRGAGMKHLRGKYPKVFIKLLDDAVEGSDHRIVQIGVRSRNDKHMLEQVRQEIDNLKA